MFLKCRPVFLDYLCLFVWLDSVHAYLTRIPQGRCHFLSESCPEAHTILLLPYNHLVKVLPGFSTLLLVFFLLWLLSSLWGDILRLCKPLISPIRLSPAWFLTESIFTLMSSDFFFSVLKSMNSWNLTYLMPKLSHIWLVGALFSCLLVLSKHPFIFEYFFIFWQKVFEAYHTVCFKLW